MFRKVSSGQKNLPIRDYTDKCRQKMYLSHKEQTPGTLDNFTIQAHFQLTTQKRQGLKVALNSHIAFHSPVLRNKNFACFYLGLPFTSPFEAHLLYYTNKSQLFSLLFLNLQISLYTYYITGQLFFFNFIFIFLSEFLGFFQKFFDFKTSLYF